jgi:hypothetical protein
VLATPTVVHANIVQPQEMLARPTLLGPGDFMLRFRLNELITECNQRRNTEDRLHMQSLADAVSVPRSTLAGLTTLNREPTTNTATLEALCRFFQLHHPDFQVVDLFEFHPPLPESTDLEVDILYPERAAKREEARRRARRRS